jgi:hypothetical protein
MPKRGVARARLAQPDFGVRRTESLSVSRTHRVLDALNEALFPGRVPHVRLTVRGPKKDRAQPVPMLCATAEGP